MKARPPRAARRRLLLTLGALLLIGGLLFAYARSEDALQRFYLPLTSRRLGVELEAEGLHIGMGPRVELRRVALVHPATGLVLLAESVSSRWALIELLRGGVPRLNDLRVEQLTVVVPAPREEEAEPPSAGPRTAPWIPVAIDNARIERIRFSVSDEAATWLRGTIGPLDLVALDPGRTTRLTAPVDLRFSPTASLRVFRLTGPAEFQLEQPQAGRMLRWNLDWPVSLTESEPIGGTGAPLALSIGQTLGGALAADGQSTHSLRAEARGPERAAGSVTAELHVGPSPGADAASPRRSLDLRASGEGIQPALVNPLLAAAGPESLQSGELAGRVNLTLSGDVVSIDSDIAADQLRLAANADHGETPPLDLRLVQQATLRREARILQVDRSSLRVLDADRLVIEADLTAPFHFAFDDRSSTESAPAVGEIPRALAGDGRPPARLELTLDRIEIERLRPWTAVWGSTLLRSARSGLLTGNLTAELAPSATGVALGGELDVRGLVLQGPEGEASRGPFEIRTSFEGRSPDLSRIELDAVALDIGATQGSLFSIEGRGTADRELGILMGRGTADITDLPFTLRQLDLLRDGKHFNFVAGSARLELEAERQGLDEASHLTGDLHFRELRLTAEERELVRSAYTSFSARIPARQRGLETIELVMQATDAAGQPAGTLSAGGYWPLRHEEAGPESSAGGVAGKIGMKLRGFDLLPWLELFGYRAEGPEAFPWPASADVTLTVDPRGEIFTLEGEERIGPITP